MPRECLEKKVKRKMKLGLPMVGLRERLLFEAKTKYNELRGKEAPVKVEVKNEKAVEGPEQTRDAPPGSCLKFFKTGHCPFGLRCRYSHKWNSTADEEKYEESKKASGRENCLSNAVSMTSSKDPSKRRKIRPEGTVQVNREVYHKLLQNSGAVEEGEVERLRKEIGQLRKRNVLLEEKNLRLEQEKKVLEKMLSLVSNLPNKHSGSRIEVEPVAVKDEPLPNFEKLEFGEIKEQMPQDQKQESHLNWKKFSRFDQKEDSISKPGTSQHPAHQLALTIGPISSKRAKV